MKKSELQQLIREVIREDSFRSEREDKQTLRVTHAENEARKMWKSVKDGIVNEEEFISWWYQESDPH